MGRIQKSKKEIYIESLYKEDEILKDIKLSVDKKLQPIQIGITEGLIINLLLKSINASKVLELGTLAGNSTLWIARALKERGNVISIEKSEENYKNALKNLSSLPEFEKITLINDDAIGFLKNLDDTFDAVFIDANKTSYPFYLEESYRLLRKGGLVIADNVFSGGQITGEVTPFFDPQILETMQSFNETVANHKGFESCILPTSEGLTVAFKI